MVQCSSDNFFFNVILEHLLHSSGTDKGNNNLHLVQIGDKVLVKAAQHHKDGGWYAEDITVIKNTWDHEKQQEPLEIDLNILQSRVVLGKVTVLQDAVGRIDADVTFDVDDCKDGYVPVLGDWVSANVVEEMVENSKFGWIKCSDNVVY